MVQKLRKIRPNNRKESKHAEHACHLGFPCWGPLELVERPIPDPTPGTVRIKVQACGVCHSDVRTKEGHWPGLRSHEFRGTMWSA
jgi:Alcohol dehydrogenase GroES-like domain